MFDQLEESVFKDQDVANNQVTHMVVQGAKGMKEEMDWAEMRRLATMMVAVGKDREGLEDWDFGAEGREEIGTGMGGKEMVGAVGKDREGLGRRE